jgi:hypothetical protein
MDGAKRCMMLAQYDLCAGEGLKSAAKVRDAGYI